ncbi:hypothetical protein DUNSADRAFT_16332, partial [Dunaliella salina]
KCFVVSGSQPPGQAQYGGAGAPSHAGTGTCRHCSSARPGRGAGQRTAEGGGGAQLAQAAAEQCSERTGALMLVCLHVLVCCPCPLR